MKPRGEFLTGVALLVLGIAAVVGGIGVGAQAVTHNISGNISGPQADETGICVLITDTNNASITQQQGTNATGNYNINISGSGFYKLFAFDGPDAGCATSIRSGTADADGAPYAPEYFNGTHLASAASIIDATGGPVVINEVLIVGRTITGNVTDAATVLPLQDVTVTVTDVNGNTFTDKTDAAGDYEIAGLPPLSGMVVNFQKTGYASENYDDKVPPASMPVDVSGGSAAGIDAGLTPAAATPTPTASGGAGSGAKLEKLTDAGGSSTTKFMEGQSGIATYSGLDANTSYTLGLIQSPFSPIATGTSDASGNLVIPFSIPVTADPGPATLALRHDPSGNIVHQQGITIEAEEDEDDGPATPASPAAPAAVPAVNVNQTQTQEQNTGSSLPKTGAEAGLYSVGGSSLLGAGWLLSRQARRRINWLAKRDERENWVNPDW